MNEFHKLLITMIIGGLGYSIMSFAYMHSNFSTAHEMQQLDDRVDRVELRIEARLKSIDDKLDGLVNRR
jgi:flagellar motor switch protein FliM